jgi:hypothetical protein
LNEPKVTYPASSTGGGFQRISVDLAHDLDRLKMLRTKLRDQMRTGGFFLH